MENGTYHLDARWRRWEKIPPQEAQRKASW